MMDMKFLSRFQKLNFAGIDHAKSPIRKSLRAIFLHVVFHTRVIAPPTHEPRKRPRLPELDTFRSVSLRLKHVSCDKARDRANK